MPPLVALNPSQARTAAAIFARLFPADPSAPGADAIGVLDYVDRALAGPYRERLETYRLGLAALDQTARAGPGRAFAACAAVEQDQLLRALERGELPSFPASAQVEFFELLRTHLLEGLFADPIYGGNRDKLGWRVLGHPGAWLENSFEEAMAAEPADKGGRIQSIADLDLPLAVAERDVPGYDAGRGLRPPDGPADVILVGVGGMGGVVAPILARGGLKVVGLEAGPWRDARDFRPDELGAGFYARATMSTKFLEEAPRWRTSADQPTGEATYSLGRMVNGVGGSIVHYGCWLRRFHPHHFKPLSFVRDRWGPGALPAGCTLSDWPIDYDDLEPYYTRLEYVVGVAGDSRYPEVPRSAPYPMPPLRPFKLGERFRQATDAMGLHAYPVPVGMNSVPYDGRPATRYSAWNSVLGSLDDDHWHPALSTVPAALATGNFDLRTHCRVVRVLVDAEGHASGVEYVDAAGNLRSQPARTVILCGYTFENVRLLFLSGDARHPNGLGNNRDQVGKHYMTKMFSDVSGFFPDEVFNRHTGPAAQSLILDDFVAPGFDSLAHGFLGGATLSAENMALPLQIARGVPPPEIPRWGQPFKDFLRQWQHVGSLRIQPDALPYQDNYLDLDPVHRDRSGLGFPVVRITYGLQPNEQRLAAWMEAMSEEILRRMGASRTWRGPRFTGVVSSHDLGGCRMGEDPADSVVDANLQVHDTPGLYVFGGAAFPSCPGINPTLTAWAVCCRAPATPAYH